MEATKLCSSFKPSLHPYSLHMPRRRDHVRPVFKAMREMRGGDFRGDIVDENMIVLRMRIKEMNMLEMNHEPPPYWMEWEKKYLLQYNTHVCEAMGLLQNYLLNVRPSLALGTVALVTFSLIISTGLVFSQAVEAAKGVLSIGTVYLESSN